MNPGFQDNGPCIYDNLESIWCKFHFRFRNYPKVLLGLLIEIYECYGCLKGLLRVYLNVLFYDVKVPFYLG